MAEDVKSYVEQSKANWGTRDLPTNEQINTGCLQRIATATEKMAASYDAMRRDRDYWQARCEQAMKSLKQSRHRVAAIRGVITKLKAAKD